MPEQTENSPPPGSDEAGNKKLQQEQLQNPEEEGRQESAKLFKQGTEQLQKSAKTGDAGGGIAAFALIVAALFAFRRERREAQNNINAAPDTGGMDARTVDNPEEEIGKTNQSLTSGQDEEKKLQDEEAKLKTDLEALRKTELPAGPNVKLQQDLQTQISTVQSQRIKLTGSRAQLQARVTALNLERGRRDRLAQAMTKSIQANPNRIGESVQRSGNTLTIALRDGRPLTAADTNRLQEIQKQFGGYGLQISGSGNPLTLTVPAMFWSEWTAGQSSVGRGARLSILSFLRGPEPVAPQETEKQEQQKKKSAPPQENLPPQPPAKQNQDKTKQGNQPEQKTKSDGQPETKTKNQESEKKTKEQAPPAPYSPQEFLMKREAENISKTIEDLVNGTANVQTVVRIDELNAALDKAYKAASDEQWKASGEENSLGWAQVNADREAMVAPALYPKQVAEKQKAATEAKQKYEKAQQTTKRLLARRDRLSALSKDAYTEKQRRDAIVGFMNRTPEGGVRLEFISSPVNTLAIRELLNLGGTPGYQNRVRIDVPPLPGSAWRLQPDASGPTVEMIVKLVNGRALSAQEESALRTLAPVTAAVLEFNRSSRVAEVTLTPEGDLALQMKMASSHPQFADARKRFVEAASRVTPVRGESGNIIRFDPDALRQPGVLERIRLETEGNLREVTPQQSDRESLLLLIDSLPMNYSRFQYNRAWAEHMTNGIIVEQVIAALTDRGRDMHDFTIRTGIYCDEQGNIRERANPPAEGRMLIRNWATTFRATPAVGVALLSAINQRPTGLFSGEFNPDALGKSLESVSRSTTMRRLSTAEQNADLNRRAMDIQVGDLYSRMQQRLADRIQTFQTMLSQRDGLSFWDHVSENFIMGTISPAGLIALNLARAAGLENPLDVRPSTAMRQIRKRTQEALKVNEQLLKNLRNNFNRNSTPRQQIEFVETIRSEMADLNFTDINTRLEWCRKACDVMERGLGYADMAGQTFAERVPVLGPVLYSSLRNGVGMMAGEQIRNPDGTYRPRDWGDFGIDVAISTIPMGSRIPGLRQVGSMGVRMMIRRLGTTATRHVLRATLEQSKDMLKQQLQQIMQKVRDGKSWEEIWDETLAQEGDELIVSFFIGTAARIVASVAGDQAGKTMGDYANRSVRMARPQMQDLSRATTKMIRERVQKLTARQLEGPVKELINDIVDNHPEP